MNQALMERFVKLIAKNTGLLIRYQDWNALHRKLLIRSDALKLSSLEEYYQLLERDSYPKNLETSSDWTELTDRNHHPTPTTGIVENIEWKKLIQLLTTGESYFFRDSGQFFLLKNIIFPELIAEQRQVWEKKQQDKPTLRIWSAGCSTGEEPYSLAILLTELIPDWKNWHLHILGTDINIASIQKAQAGLYGTWSFRTVDEGKKTSYFHLEKSGWKIEKHIKNLVTFKTGNLVQDKFPDSTGNLFNMDLIICRNVFVYFEPQAIAQVLQKFYQTLKPGGYLVTAHAELYGQDLGLFSSKVFPQSVIYQRPKEPNWENENSPSKIEPSDERSNQCTNILTSSHFHPHPIHGEFYHNSRIKTHVVKPINLTNYPGLSESTALSCWPNFSAISDPLTGQTETPQSAKDLSSQLNIEELNKLFDNHRYPEVIKVAKQMISLHPNNYEVYYIMAKTCANLGNYSEAENYCYQAIEFNYSWVDPYYLLAEIAEERGDIETAKAMFKKIIYLSPASIYAYLQIADLYEKEGNYIRAKKMRKNVVFILEKMPKNAWLNREEEKILAGDLLNYIKRLL